MDNIQQLKEIIKYHKHLKEVIGIPISYEIAAELWVHKYASIWRLHHPRTVA